MRKDYGYAILTIVLILYVAVRTCTVDFTHDEAYSFHNVKHFWYPEALCTGNTHWLNSFAIKAALLFHLECNWQLRWFSLLSTIVFCFICFLWIRSLNKTYHKIFAFCLLLMNPYIIDYLGLARGYATGLMFEGLSIFLFILSLQNQKRKYAFASLVCAGLSAISNFGFIYFFAAFALVYYYTYYLKNIGYYKKTSFYIDTIWCLAVSALFIRAWIFIMKCSGDVVGAGTDNLNEMSNSYLSGLLYHYSDFNNTNSIIISYLFLAVAVVPFLFGILMHKSHSNNVFYYTSLILGSIILMITIGHIFFRTVLPYQRSAVFLFPLISVCLIYFLIYCIPSKVQSLLFIIVSGLLVGNFIRNINFTHTLDYAAQENTRFVFNYLDSINAKKVAMSNETYGVYINYYQMTDNSKYHFKGDFIGLADSLPGYDYLLLSPPYFTCNYDRHHLKFDTIKRFRDNNILLLKPHPY